MLLSFKKRRFITLKQSLAFLLLSSLCAIVSFDRRYAKSIEYGLVLWYANILPCLFPYLVLTAFIGKLSVVPRIFNKLGRFTAKIFKTRGVIAYAIFISMLCGYPVGSKTMSDLVLTAEFDSD